MHESSMFNDLIEAEYQPYHSKFQETDAVMHSLYSRIRKPKYVEFYICPEIIVLAYHMKFLCFFFLHQRRSKKKCRKSVRNGWRCAISLSCKIVRTNGNKFGLSRRWLSNREGWWRPRVCTFQTTYILKFIVFLECIEYITQLFNKLLNTFIWSMSRLQNRQESNGPRRQRHWNHIITYCTQRFEVAGRWNSINAEK